MEGAKMETEHAQGHAHEPLQEHPHIVPDRVFLAVWAVLLGLTALLVVVSRSNHEMLSVPAMLTVTPLKAALVFYFFMHLRYEKTLLKTMVFVALATLVVFIGLLFLDVSYR